MNLIAIFILINTAWSFVQVNPVRLNLENSRFSYFTVKNTQSKRIKIGIENKYYSMMPDGNMTQKESADKDNIKTIIFSPKEFTLAPGGKQVVRFFIKDQSTQIELRSHIYLLSEESNEESERTSTKESTMELKPKIAIAIPLIFRTKTEKENIKITEIKANQIGPSCNIEMMWKNAHHSSYINLEVYTEKDVPVFKLNGVSNYLNSFNWKTEMPNTKCETIKRIKIFDVDNEVYVVNSELKL